MSEKQREIYNYLLKHPGYLKKGIGWLWINMPVKGISTIDEIVVALKQAKYDTKKPYLNSKEFSDEISSNIGKELALKAIKTSSKSTSTKNNVTIKSITQKGYNKSIRAIKGRKYDEDNVLFIGDLHSPWILDGYLDFCKEQQEKYNCGTVIFAGDIIDSGSWNYHEPNPDGMSVKDELYAAKKQLKEVYKMFPKSISLLGNHDLLISRKAKTAGLSQEFIRDLGSVIDAPKDWLFCHEIIRDNVRYIHGSTGDAFKRAVDSRMSTCQGHLHSKTFVQWSVSEKDAIFGLQVGAGFDRNKYAFDYAKPFTKKPVISCGLILESGKVPLVKLMPL